MKPFKDQEDDACAELGLTNFFPEIRAEARGAAERYSNEYTSAPQMSKNQEFQLRSRFKQDFFDWTTAYLQGRDAALSEAFKQDPNRLSHFTSMMITHEIIRHKSRMNIHKRSAQREATNEAMATDGPKVEKPVQQATNKIKSDWAESMPLDGAPQEVSKKDVGHQGHTETAAHEDTVGELQQEKETVLQTQEEEMALDNAHSEPEQAKDIVPETQSDEIVLDNAPNEPENEQANDTIPDSQSDEIVLDNAPSEHEQAKTAVSETQSDEIVLDNAPSESEQAKTASPNSQSTEIIVDSVENGQKASHNPTGMERGWPAPKVRLAKNREKKKQNKEKHDMMDLNAALTHLRKAKEWAIRAEKRRDELTEQLKKYNEEVDKLKATI